MTATVSRDPGWRAVVRVARVAAVQAFRRRPAAEVDLLTGARLLGVALVLRTLVTSPAVVLATGAPDAPAPVVAGAVAVTMVLAAAAAVAGRAAQPMLDGRDPERLAASYRLRWGIRYATVFVTGLLGVVAALATASLVPYLAALAVVAVALRWAGPSRAAVQHDQRTLTEQCSPLDLVGVLLASELAPARMARH